MLFRSETLRDYKRQADAEIQNAANAQALQSSIALLDGDDIKSSIQIKFDEVYGKLSDGTKQFLQSWDEKKKDYFGEEIKYFVGSKEICVSGGSQTICGSFIPKVIPPSYQAWGELVKFYFMENLPGEFPFTAGVFPFKRTSEDPKRQFAGEGDPDRKSVV